MTRKCYSTIILLNFAISFLNVELQLMQLFYCGVVQINYLHSFLYKN